VSIRVECDPDAFNDVLIYMYSASLSYSKFRNIASSTTHSEVFLTFWPFEQGRLSIRPEHAVELLWISLHYEMEALARVYTTFLEQVNDSEHETGVMLLMQ
jgi:hypothetical protein